MDTCQICGCEWYYWSSSDCCWRCAQCGAQENIMLLPCPEADAWLDELESAFMANNPF